MLLAMGGEIALEIAQQLRRSGQEVALVAAIDSEIHTAPRPFRESDVLDWMLTRFGDVVSRQALLPFDAARLGEAEA